MINDQIRKTNYENLFFITFPIWKLILLSLLTFGMYECVWFYKYWKTIKETNNEQISPFWRAFFAGISGFWLFPILEKYIRHHNFSLLSGTGLAISYFILCALSRGSELVCLLSLLSIVPIIIIQSKINKINETINPKAEQYHWSWKTTLGLICFWGIFISYVIILSVIEVLKDYN